MNEWIKVQKINSGEMNEVGLPVYDFVYLNKRDILLETKTSYTVKRFDEQVYQAAVQASRCSYNASGTITTMYLNPNPTEPCFYKTVAILKPVADDQVISTTIKYFICRDYEVSEHEFKRVAELLGCEL